MTAGAVVFPRRKWGARDEAPPPPDTPVILIPTARQRAAGVRLVDAPEDLYPKTLRSLVKVLTGTAWRWRATYSQILAPPKRGAQDWDTVDVVLLRLYSDLGCPVGYGGWHNGDWDGGAWWRLRADGRTIALETYTAVGATILGKAIKEGRPWWS